MREERRIKVLVVDDDQHFRNLATGLLEKCGFEVSSVGTGEEALYWIRNNDIDVAVLDLRLPDFDGNELLRSFKIIRPDLEVIILTGYGTMRSALLAMREDVFEYLTKPCSTELLAEVICKAAAKKASPMCARWYNIWAGSELKEGYSEK
ncbi:MAG: response regulator [Candidatus Abyssobacteria bacterium SURF_5]|uniref:Response regulator n=1 Tax=Abyssobacteria bacterium (strain SURF_5) TaxID=2093360 RepID=A0A3A4NNL4_ABYX5|nr:MAG: response regulator [Candidatus Abyssubacteria bacterium SURF_5]